MASPEQQVEEEKRARNSHKEQWVERNRSQTEQRSSGLKSKAKSYYELNPINPSTQDVTVLHYQCLLRQLAESEEASKYQERA